MIYFFTIILSIMVYLYCKFSKSIVNVVSVFTIPYIIVAVINNMWAVQYGFYPIFDETLLMIGNGLLAIGIGSTVATVLLHKKHCYVEKLQHYNIKRMKKYIIIIECICIIKLIYILYFYGAWYLAAEEGDGINNFLSGPVGHLFLSIYAILPVMLYKWLKDRGKYSYLVVYIIGIMLSFCSFTKYHVIGLIIMTYIFLSLENKKYIKSGIGFVVLTPIFMFCLNYILGFIFSGSLNSVDNDFYLMHLWKYIGGSIVNGNLVVTSGWGIGSSFIDKILSWTIPFFVMFTNAIFDYKPKLDISGEGMQPVGDMGEYSNVVDFISGMYPSHGDVVDNIIYIILMLSIGFVFTIVYNALKQHKNKFNISAAIFLTFFCFFSFFGKFISISTPWEILLLGTIIPNLFYKKVWCYEKSKRY